jgi:hypothetical protein
MAGQTMGKMAGKMAKWVINDMNGWEMLGKCWENGWRIGQTWLER